MRRGVALALVLALAACATPSPVTREAVAALEPGRTTLDDAVARFGPPQSTGQVGGALLVQWIGVQLHQGHHLVAAFDPAPPHRLQRVQSLSLTP